MNLFKNKTAVAALVASALSLLGHNANAKQSLEVPEAKTVDTSLSSINLHAALLESNPSGSDADLARAELLQLAASRGHGGRGGRSEGRSHGHNGNRGGRGGRGGHDRPGHTGYAS